MKHRSFSRSLRAVAVTGMFLLCMGMLPGSISEASSLTCHATVTSQTSVTIKVKFSKDVVKWRIRQKVNYAKKYKTVKYLKKSKKTVTLKGLKKNTFYQYEVCGLAKKNGKLKPVIYDYCTAYTGMMDMQFAVYATTDAFCSPKRIDVWMMSDGSGALKPDGILLYRQKDGEKKYEKIADLPYKWNYTYKDKKVEAGAKYRYKVRSYGTVKGEKIYSKWSEVMTRSAVNQDGIFTSEVIKRNKKVILLKLTSADYNGDLQLDSYMMALCNKSGNIEGNEGDIGIESFSKDGKKYKKVGKKWTYEMKGGETLYLRLGAADGVDARKGKWIGTYSTEYNGEPGIFILNIKKGSGTAFTNMEMVH